jgi:hypothetical protein
MNTYSINTRRRNNSKIHRRIYQKHYGPIPKEANGRSYEIHHVDGNHSNNDPLNLKAVTIQEHYDIHYAQGDFAACILIGSSMKISTDELVKICKRHNDDMLKKNIHPFQRRLDGSSLSNDRVKNGTHNFINNTPNLHSQYDHSIYCFKNIITQENVHASQYEFRIKYNLHQPSVSKLVRGLYKTHKNWIIIR